MTNLVGWMINFSGVSSGRSTNIRIYSSAAFPARTQIESLVSGQALLHVRFAPNGGWIIICSGNVWQHGNNLPADLVTTITTGIQGGLLTLADVFFTPNNDWVIKWKQSNGSRTYSQSNNFPNEIMDLINELDVNGTGSELLCLAYPPPSNIPAPSSSGLDNNVWTSCLVLCDNNKYSVMGSLPNDLATALTTIVGQNGVLRSVIFSSPTGWLVTTTTNNYSASASFDAWVLQQLRQAVQVFSNNGVTLGDVLIEVPVRNYTFQIVSIKCSTTRAGPANYQDTLYGAVSITVANQDTTTSPSPPAQSQTVYFGNWIRSNDTLGLNGNSNLNPNSILSNNPAGPGPQYAISVGPIQISDPKASVVFSLALLNQGSGLGELTGPLKTVATAALGIAQGAITALFSYLGSPALGSVIGQVFGQIANLGLSNCDGLVAVDTIATSASTLAGLGTLQLAISQTPSGAVLTTTQAYNNTTFPDNAFTGTKSPYDQPSGSCQAPNYALTYAILEADTESATNYSAPVSSGSSQYIKAATSWPEGQPINNTDQSGVAPAACMFLNKLYLFWMYKNSIFSSNSVDGHTWPAGAPTCSNGQTRFSLSPCVFQNQTPQTQLYLFWTDFSTYKIMYDICTDGATWQTQGGTPINSSDSTSSSPTACVFQNQLFLFWKANDSSNRIYFSAYSGATDDFGNPLTTGSGGPWPAGTQINSTDSTSGPLAACVFQNQLFLFWPANDSSNKIYFTSSKDGKTWPVSTVLDTTDSTPLALAACVFQNQLFLFWRANDASNLIYFSSSWNGKTWSPGATINATDDTLLPVAASVFQNQILLFWVPNNTSPCIYTSASQSPVTMSQTEVLFVPQPPLVKKILPAETIPQAGPGKP